MPEIKSITIVGGGLAGLSLAIALRRQDVPVVVHEAGTYPRHRVCGEFLSGEGRNVLKTLGVADVLEGGVPQETTAWYFGERKIYAADLPDPGCGISRVALDAGLRKKVEEFGGVVKERSRLRPESAEGFVWCGGRIPARGEWIGLKCHLPDLPLEADLEMHLGSNGYVGLARVDGNRVNVCGLFRCDVSLGGVLPSYLRHGGLNSLANRLETVTPDKDSCVAVAGFRPGWQQERPGMLAVGDACGMIPPFAGNGMSMAFEAASEAGEPLADFAKGKSNWRSACAAVRGRMRCRFSRRLLGARVMHPFLTERAGQALLAAVSSLRLLPFGFAFRLLR